MSETKEQSQAQEVTLGEKIHPFKNLSGNSLPLSLVSETFHIPNVGSLTFEISPVVEPKVDTKRFGFSQPNALKVIIRPDTKSNTDKKLMDIASYLGLITNINNRKLWGIPDFSEEHTIIISGWTTKPLKAVNQPQKASAPSPLILDTDNIDTIKNLSVELKDLSMGKLKAA